MTKSMLARFRKPTMLVRSKSRLCLLLTLAITGSLAASAQSTSSVNRENCDRPVREEAGKLLFLTGTPSGNYFRVGSKIADVARSHGLTNLEVRCTNRTFENMRQLKPGGAAFALVQSDVAHAFWYGHTRYADENSDAKAVRLPYLVAPLYIEALHIIIRPHLNISSPAELRHHRVWLGEAHQGPKEELERGGAPPSGTEFTARRVLEAADLNNEDIDALETASLDNVRCPNDHRQIRELTFQEAKSALLSMCLDAMFSVGMVPNDKIWQVLNEPAVTDAADTSAIGRPSLGKSSIFKKSSAKTELAEARLLSLDYALVRRLVQDGSYVEKLIASDDYGEGEPTLTVGVQALLLGRNDLANKAVIKELATIIRSYRSEIEGKLGMKAPSDLGLLGMEVRPRLLAHAPQNGSPYVYNTWTAVWVPFLSICSIALLSLSWLVYLRRAYVGRLISENNLLVPAIIGLLLLWISSSFLLNQFEGEVNERLSSFPRALYYGLFYIIPGLNFPTLTENGQTTQRIGQWIVGVVLLGGVFAPFVTRELVPRGLSEISMRMMRRGVVKGKLKDHIVIINHSPHADDLIRRLHSPRVRNKREVVVISPSPIPLPSEPEFNNVFTAVGDVTDKSVLMGAQVDRAYSVAILSAWPPIDPNDRRKFLRGDQADSKTIIAIQSVCDALSNAAPPITLPIVAELKSRKHIRAAQLAARNDNISLVCDEDLGIELLTQGVSAPGLTKLYKEIINGSDNRSELRRMELPSECVGGVFQNVIVYFANKRKNSNSAEIPIGIYRESNLFMNPVDRDIGTLKRSDALLVIAERSASHDEQFDESNTDRPPRKPAA
jgi:TRAP-type uncharacterized transport system substrate-binding protein